MCLHKPSVSLLYPLPQQPALISAQLHPAEPGRKASSWGSLSGAGGWRVASPSSTSLGGALLWFEKISEKNQPGLSTGL